MCRELVFCTLLIILILWHRRAKSHPEGLAAPPRASKSPRSSTQANSRGSSNIAGHDVVLFGQRTAPLVIDNRLN